MVLPSQIVTLPLIDNFHILKSKVVAHISLNTAMANAVTAI